MLGCLNSYALDHGRVEQECRGRDSCGKSSLQDKIEDMAAKRKEQQAEYDRVSEIHRGRLESSSVDATDAATVTPR